MRLEGFSSKGSDAAYGAQRLWVYPEVRINQALRLRAVYAMQGNLNANYTGGGANWATNPHYAGWIVIDSRDLYADTGLAAPILRAFWVTAETPLGIITMGTRPGAFGLGWALHEQDSYARSLALIVPYGPLAFVWSQYVHGSLVFTDPNDDRNTRLSPLTINSSVDQNLISRINTAIAFTYRSANVDSGALLYVLRRDGQHHYPQPGGTYQDDRSSNGIMMIVSNAAALNTVNVPIYVASGGAYQGIFYVKYSDGRFFLGAEIDFLKMEITRNGGRPVSGFGNAWALESGLLLGPTKITLANFFKSGHDRRGGYFSLLWPTGRLGPLYVYDRFDYFVSFLGGGEGPIRPYTHLMSAYGGGNNSFTSSGSCTFDDFLGFAARIDHAVASNLNLFTSVLFAYRASNTATPQGFYVGTWAPGVATNQANSPGNGTIGGLAIHPWTPWVAPYSTPNVPETDLGYEVNAGCRWKLLEGMTFNFLAAYWQPGKWFRWAYRDMTISNPTNYNPADPSTIPGRVNPLRTIDPIMGIQAGFLVEF